MYSVVLIVFLMGMSLGAFVFKLVTRKLDLKRQDSVFHQLKQLKEQKNTPGSLKANSDFTIVTNPKWVTENTYLIPNVIPESGLYNPEEMTSKSLEDMISFFKQNGINVKLLKPNSPQTRFYKPLINRLSRSTTDLIQFPHQLINFN